MNAPVALRAGSLDGTVHGFFTRQGGCSEGLYTSLNCGFGSQDDATSVAANRDRVAQALGVAPTHLVTLYQIHGAACATVIAPWMRDAAPRADAMVTDRPGIALGILTADCVPVLFADRAAEIVGAAHAGWKGARAGVIEATLEAMQRLGADPSRIACAIGPAIAQASYEVGPEFRATLIADDADNDRFFVAGALNRAQFDLPAYVAARIAAAGISRCERILGDTAAEEDRFFSYRRSVLRREADYGRAISAIGLG